MITIKPKTQNPKSKTQNAVLPALQETQHFEF